MRTSQVLFAVLLVGTLAVASAQTNVNITEVLKNYPQFSTFARLMSETGVVNEVNSRSSVTILMPENGVLDAYVGAHQSYTTQMAADVLRYHCLLQYFGGQELAELKLNEGYEVTTVYQTTGRANGLDGFVNLTKTATVTTVGPSTPGTPPQANLLTNITQFPYNYSFIQISAVLEPLGLAAAQLAPTSPPTVAPVPAPAMTPTLTPTLTPSMSPSTTPSMTPTMTPSTTPSITPSTTPSTTPTMAPLAPSTVPVKAPTKAPTTAPTTPVAPGPVEGPAASVSSGTTVTFNAVALAASLAVAALCL